MTTKTDPKATGKRDYTVRTTYDIENGNGARFIKKSYDECLKIAQEAAANTNGTLKAINAYLYTNRRRLHI